MALGRLRRGFFVSPAAIWEGEQEERTPRDLTYSNDLSTNKRESSVGKDGPKPKKPAFCTRNPRVLSKSTWVFPVAETDTVVVGASSEVKDETQYDETSYCDNLDRTVRVLVSGKGRNWLTTHAKINSASP